MTESVWRTLAILLVGSAMLSHFGLRLSAYNRLNALGWRRHTIKRIEKFMFAETWVTFFVIPWICRRPIGDLLATAGDLFGIPLWLKIYAGIHLAIGSVLGTLWLIWRPIFGVQHVDAPYKSEVISIADVVDQPLARTTKCRLASWIPGNQIFELDLRYVDLPVVGLPRSLDGYRIAHLSDIHLTGHIGPEFTAYAIARANQWRPDLMAVTGDIVDADACVEWLHDLFGSATAVDGCFFILGNHDTRVSDPNHVRRAMTNAGWTDVGGEVHKMNLRGVPVAFIGNESPWFPRPNDRKVSEAKADFRICLSHSPDQFDWCRRLKIELMLCGHTHGGQGRLPLIGPLLSPSFHGSRWASGDFYRSPTTLHVTRGLSGVHLLRINCRPELSLLTLRAAE